PRVRAGDVGMEPAPHIDPAVSGPGRAVDAGDLLAARTEETIEVCTLTRKETGLVAVASPVLDVGLAVADVEIARDQCKRLDCGKPRHPLLHGIEESPLLVLLRSVGLARVHVGADDRPRRAAEG